MKAKINNQLENLCQPIDNFHEDPTNVKKHTPKNLRRIKRSLRKFGQQKPIVTIPDGTIIAGNGTFRMAKTLGWEKIARVEYSDEKTARQYALMDNRSSEGAGYHKDRLEFLLDSLEEADEDFDPADVGFEDDDIGTDEDGGMVGEAMTYSVIVDFATEKEQAKLLAELEKRGLQCRLLIS